MAFHIQGRKAGGNTVAAVTISVTFDSSKATKMARGFDNTRFVEEAPVGQEILDFIKAEVIEHMKVAFRRGDKQFYADDFVPENDVDPTF